MTRCAPFQAVAPPEARAAAIVNARHDQRRFAETGDAGECVDRRRRSQVASQAPSGFSYFLSLRGRAGRI